DPTLVLASDPRRVPHTRAQSGRVPVRLNQIDGSSESDVAHDIALIRLDRAVPPGVTQPLRPAGVNGVARCPDSFDGVLVGYGKVNFYGSQPTAAVRNYAPSNGWSRENPEPGNDLFANTWNYKPAPDDGWYDGAVPGDSGGALLSNAGNMLCGAISRMWLA